MRLGEVVAGDIFLLKDRVLYHKVTVVTARFDDYRAQPGPQVVLALANGATSSGLGSDRYMRPRPWLLGPKARLQPLEATSAQAMEAYLLLITEGEIGRDDAAHRDLQDLTRQAGLAVDKFSGGMELTPAGEVWLLSRRGEELMPEAMPPKPQPTVINTGNLVMVGDHASVSGNITQHIAAIPDQPGADEVRHLLSDFAQRIAEDAALPNRQEPLGYVDYLAKTAAEDPVEQHPAAVAAVYRHLSEGIKTAAALTALWANLSAPLASLLHIHI